MSFFYKGKEIKQTVELQAERTSQNEITVGVNETLLHLEQLATELSTWDEVRQQLTDSSYYFYWRDQSLKQSSYFQSYYTQVELYHADGQRIVPLGKSNMKQQSFLPNLISGTPKNHLILDNQNSVHFLQFKPIYETGSTQLLGYVGISSNFISALFSHAQLIFTQKNSIQFDGSQFNYH